MDAEDAAIDRRERTTVDPISVVRTREARARACKRYGALPPDASW